MTPFEKYIRILLVEMEDLEEQLEELINHYTTPDKTHGLTERVCLENQSVIRCEERGIDTIIDILKNFDTTPYKDIETMVRDLKVQIKEELKKKDLPMATYMFAETRMNSVREYIKAG